MSDPVKVSFWAMLMLIFVALTSADFIRFELGKSWSIWENLAFTVAWAWLIGSAYKLLLRHKKRP